MQINPVHERLRLRRIERGESLAEVARRAGVREALLHAIECGDFDRLPSGIYGRAAVRNFAEALGLDGKAVLAECDSRFVPLDDQVVSLARIRGLPTTSPVPGPIVRFRSKTADALSSRARLIAHEFPRLQSRDVNRIWRVIAAAIVDGGIVLAMILALVGSTVVLFGRSALSSESGVSYAIVAVLLASGYFAVFGGIRGQTVGARVARLDTIEPHTRVDLAGIAVRAFRCASRDAQVIDELAGRILSLSGRCRYLVHRRDGPRVEQPAGP
jgi:transcriptional regulator with XRE-family HTH domain